MNIKYQFDQYELAMLLTKYSPYEIARKYKLHLGTIYRQIRNHKLHKQPVPLEDIELMLNLYYHHGWSVVEILEKFKDEITVMTRSMLSNILFPKHQYNRSTYQEALNYWRSHDDYA